MLSHASHMTHLCPLVVVLGNGVKPLCSCSVPHLKTHLLSINSQGLHFKINSCMWEWKWYHSPALQILHIKSTQPNCIWHFRVCWLCILWVTGSTGINACIFTWFTTVIKIISWTSNWLSHLDLKQESLSRWPQFESTATQVAQVKQKLQHPRDAPSYGLTRKLEERVLSWQKWQMMKARAQSHRLSFPTKHRASVWAQLSIDLNREVWNGMSWTSAIVHLHACTNMARPGVFTTNIFWRAWKALTLLEMSGYALTASSMNMVCST